MSWSKTQTLKPSANDAHKPLNIEVNNIRGASKKLICMEVDHCAMAVMAVINNRNDPCNGWQKMRLHHH